MGVILSLCTHSCVIDTCLYLHWSPMKPASHYNYCYAVLCVGKAFAGGNSSTADQLSSRGVHPYTRSRCGRGTL